MRRTELLKRIGRYVTVVMMSMLAMVAAGCGGDDEESRAGYFGIGPDKHGWYKFRDEKSVYDGIVVFADDSEVFIDTTEPVCHYRFICENITKNDCIVGDKVNFKVLRFKIPNESTCDLPIKFFAEVEL